LEVLRLGLRERGASGRELHPQLPCPGTLGDKAKSIPFNGVGSSWQPPGDPAPSCPISANWMRTPQPMLMALIERVAGEAATSA
jgi:hypothetical protein